MLLYRTSILVSSQTSLSWDLTSRLHCSWYVVHTIQYIPKLRKHQKAIAVYHSYQFLHRFNARRSKNEDAKQKKNLTGKKIWLHLKRQEIAACDTVFMLVWAVFHDIYSCFSILVFFFPYLSTHTHPIQQYPAATHPSKNGRGSQARDEARMLWGGMREERMLARTDNPDHSGRLCVRVCVC